MTQRKFTKTYPDACSSDLCERLIEWHDTDKEARTESPDRVTRRDVQKWLPLDSECWKPLQESKRNMCNLYGFIHIHAYTCAFCKDFAAPAASPASGLARVRPSLARTNP